MSLINFIQMKNGSSHTVWPRTSWSENIYTGSTTGNSSGFPPDCALMASMFSLSMSSRSTSIQHRTTPLPHLYFHRFTHHTHQFGVSLVHFLMVFKNCLPVCIYVRVFGSVNLKSFRDKSYKCGYTWIYMNMLVSLFQKWPKSFSNRSKSFGSNSKETSFGFSIFN